VVLIRATKAVLESMLAEAGVSIIAPAEADVTTTVEVFRQFAALAVEDAAPPEQDGDGILAQFGTHDFRGRPEFLADLTRQFITAGREEQSLWQLSCTFHWPCSEATDALASGSLWSFGKSVSEFFDEALELPGWAWAIQAPQAPHDVSVALDQV
jgi:hypothetical protein